MSRARDIGLGAILGTVVLLVLVTDWPLGRILIAVGVAAVVLRIGYAMISGLAQPVPEPPEPGELRKVKLTYRCSICGAEVKMTVAASEDPEPPRHCLEDMDIVAPVME